MVMQGTTTMMNNAANAGMMGPGVMMDMAGMMGPMGMGMNNDMTAMGGGMMQGIMPTDAAAQGQAAGGVGVAGQGQEQVGMLQDGAGFPGQTAGQGMMNMGMGSDFVMQVCGFVISHTGRKLKTVSLGTKSHYTAANVYGWFHWHARWTRWSCSCWSFCIPRSRYPCECSSPWTRDFCG
jgi:hypothetical protein